MTREIRDVALDPGDHVAHFYERDSELISVVARFLAAAAGAGAVAIVVATEAHRSALAVELEAAGIDAADSCRDGTLVMLDAAATLAAFASDGRVDPEAFDRVVGSIVRGAADSGRPVSIYGEMVNLLWEQGDVSAAIELENLWNELGRRVGFSLLCGYRFEADAEVEHEQALSRVCRLHSALLDRVPQMHQRPVAG